MNDLWQQPQRRALLAACDPASLDHLSQQLQALNLNAISVSTTEQLIEQLLTTEIEIIFIDLNWLETEAIIEAMHLIRGSGQTAPILLMTTPLSKAEEARLRSHDCHLLWKPIDPNALEMLLEQCLQTPRSEPLAANAAGLDDDEQRVLQRAFIETLNSYYLDDLRSALEQGSTSRAQAVLHKLKGSAGSFGYHRLGALAASADASLRQGHPLGAVMTHIDPVIAEAERLQQQLND